MKHISFSCTIKNRVKIITASRNEGAKYFPITTSCDHVKSKAFSIGYIMLLRLNLKIIRTSYDGKSIRLT